MNLLRLLPLSSPWIIRYHLGNAKTVLDVGCGDGSLMLKLNGDKKYEVLGIDLYMPYLIKANTHGVYKQLKQVDVRKINFKKRSFDVVLASQVIEHLSKKDALKLLGELEKIAKNKVIITTPNGFVKFDPFEETDYNKLQEHKSGWGIVEMEKMGYKVYGQGSRLIYTSSGLLYKYRNLKCILMFISYLLSPVTYFFPNMSAYIIAVKKV